ncbi:MAG: hypothetical protein IIU35_05750 [Neisseriaceae bacterium]|nr:hypothetical protein [Neisseriaceae bacterium]
MGAVLNFSKRITEYTPFACACQFSGCLKALPVQGRHFPCRDSTTRAGKSSLRAVPHARRGNLLKQFLNSPIARLINCFRVAYHQKRTQYKMISGCLKKHSIGAKPIQNR